MQSYGMRLFFFNNSFNSVEYGNDICNKTYCRSTAAVWGQGDEYKNTFLLCRSQNPLLGSLNLSSNLYRWLLDTNQMNMILKKQTSRNDEACRLKNNQLMFCQRSNLFSLILLFLGLNNTNKSSFNSDYFNLRRML